ncbi:Crp/Fnr family transcriptional regulator [Mangrovibacterium lignilyticum]|uniref:Crp/Fnr family transcriptional regulator n=1 Tax=Mangrovibacterium lignilyticum TaxID=2668052 RepID=UPI0013D387D9|nr:Crp/Fnr family transcriptional regulator [Mangrovibacterium lignilyticum]
MQLSLDEHINRFVPLSESEKQILSSFTKSQVVKRRGILLSNGEVSRSLYFVEKGCLRMYFINDKSAEQITQFALEGWWLTDFFSFMDNTPSDYFIQTIEASKLVSIDRLAFDELLKAVPKLERYFRIIMQKNLAASQLRTKYLYEMSKEEFYYHFSSNFPEFMQRVPQYMVASYLGLTPEYVSELRKRNS